MSGDPLFSSVSVEWETPPDLFRQINRMFGPFDLDPCATAENAKAPLYYTKAEDGLGPGWALANKAITNVFMNPPYGRDIKHWLAKAAKESMKGVQVVALLPARTDTDWWHRYVWPYCSDIYLIRGRVKFLNPAKGLNSAPFPSALCIYNPRKRAGLPRCGPFVMVFP